MTAWTDQVQGLLDGALERGAVPRAAVAVAGPQGVEGVVAAGCEPDAVWRIASCTKAVASVAALQLLEQGRIGLDTEVREVLPAFGDLQVLDGFDDDGAPVLREQRVHTTLRHLLTHTSGLSYFFLNENLKRYHEVAGTPHVLTGLRAALHNPLVADAGTAWEYGVNTDWLGLVVEELSGQAFDAYLTEHVTGPLGMVDTTFVPSAAQRERMIPMHHRAPDGSLVASELDLAPEPEFWAGGHGLHATASDYGRFIAMLLGGGELDGARVLAPETVDLMFTDHLHGAKLPEFLKSAAPEFSNDVPSLPVPQGWGLGLHLTLADLPGMRRAGTGDWAGLFNLYYWVDRTSGVGAIFCTQVLPFFDQACVETALGVEQAVYAGVGAAA
jgi:methyl acetate hydrolase